MTQPNNARHPFARARRAIFHPGIFPPPFERDPGFNSVRQCISIRRRSTIFDVRLMCVREGSGTFRDTIYESLELYWYKSKEDEEVLSIRAKPVTFLRVQILLPFWFLNDN